jgi:hypothetical protein
VSRQQPVAQRRALAFEKPGKHFGDNLSWERRTLPFHGVQRLKPEALDTVDS